MEGAQADEQGSDSLRVVGHDFAVDDLMSCFGGQGEDEVPEVSFSMVRVSEMVTMASFNRWAAAARCS